MKLITDILDFIFCTALVILFYSSVKICFWQKGP